MKHAEQVNLYGLLTFLRFPELETVHVELWYLDIDELTCRTFDRDQALRFKQSFNRRGLALTECSTCRMQIEHGAGKRALHPIKLLAMAYGLIANCELRIDK